MTSVRGDVSSLRYNGGGDTHDEMSNREWFADMLRRIRGNDPDLTDFVVRGEYEEILRNMIDEGWEQLGQNIANNTHLEKLLLYDGALDDHRMPFFFRGLTRSTSIKDMSLYENGLSVAGVRSMVPFLQNANNLNYLSLGNNNISSEGFNILFRALRDSPIEYLSCDWCGVESIEIDSKRMPRNLKYLNFYGNSINTDGCRGLATLLRGRDATLTRLWLSTNKIDDEGVAILVDALQNNASLKELDLSNNEGISVEGAKLCLRLVNDISSIKATLQSNHTLQKLTVKEIDYELLGLWSWSGMDGCNVNVQIQREIDNAVSINMMNTHSPERAGKEKVVQTQLHSGRRAELANLQGVDRSLYSEINPLHLPEVLALVGRIYGHGELHLALVSSIAILFTTVNKEECVKQQMEYHAAMTKEHESKFKAIQAELETSKKQRWSIAAENDLQLKKIDTIKLTKLMSLAESINCSAPKIDNH